MTKKWKHLEFHYPQNQLGCQPDRFGWWTDDRDFEDVDKEDDEEQDKLIQMDEDIKEEAEEITDKEVEAFMTCDKDMDTMLEDVEKKPLPKSTGELAGCSSGEEKNISVRHDKHIIQMCLLC